MTTVAQARTFARVLALFGESTATAEPFGMFMRQHGFPPETCTLIVPMGSVADGVTLPPYVLEDSAGIIRVPVLMRSKIRR